jgi:hypothetical protein
MASLAIPAAETRQETPNAGNSLASPTAETGLPTTPTCNSLATRPARTNQAIRTAGKRLATPLLEKVRQFLQLKLCYQNPLLAIVWHQPQP